MNRRNHSDADSIEEKSMDDERTKPVVLKRFRLEGSDEVQGFTG
jgi:hypothetical protein